MLLLGRLQLFEHHVEAGQVSLHERRKDSAARIHPGAGHHPQVDLASRADALLQDEACLDERLQSHQLGQPLAVRVGVARNLRFAVLVEAGTARFGSQLAFLDELLHTLMDVEGIAIALVQVLSDVVDGVEPEQVHQEERTHRRDVLGADLFIDLLDREPLLFLGAPDLADRGVEDAVDDEARDLLAHDRLLADRLREVDSGLDRLLVGDSGDDLDQRHHGGRVEEVKAHDLVGAKRRVRHLGDRQRRGV